MSQPVPVISADVIAYLERTFQVIEYSPERSTNDWAFSAGQQAVIKKLKMLYRQQKGKKYANIPQ